MAHRCTVAARRWSPGLLLLCALPLLTLPGCGGCSGCRQDPAEAQRQKAKKDAEARAKREKPEPKPDFEVSGPWTQPFDGNFAAKKGLNLQPCKPGHWTATLMAAKANNFDFFGELVIEPIDGRSRVVPLVATPYQLSTARDLSLSKGKAKIFESVLFVPRAETRTNCQFRLNDRRGGNRVTGPRLLGRMPSYQYHFIVLARFPERYNYLDSLPSMKPPGDMDAGDTFYSTTGDYHVVLMRGDREPALPSYSVLWTSIAYALWDDADPSKLTAEQRQAMLDWLQFGGYLIISGPESLDGLRDSFLADYLPADAEAVCELGDSDLDPVRRFGTDSGQEVRHLNLARPLSGVKLKLRSEGSYVPGLDGLVAERRVGRGRIVVTAFRPSGADLTSWPGWDSFLNACLMRRLPRAYGEDEYGTRRLAWADRVPDRINWGRVEQRGLHDAARSTNLRYFARDAGLSWSDYSRDLRNTDEMTMDTPAAGGIAAWEDYTPVADAARAELSEAARIEVPQRSFVAWVLAGYLVVLVPLNYLVFRGLGRVEWAWAAAPVVAVACTIAVIRLAQLDIGFVRSRTEIAVLEIQGGYDRAHVSRFTALYASVGTGYDFGCDDRGGTVLPFPRPRDEASFRMPFGRGYDQLQYRRDQRAELHGFAVASNSVGMIRSEQMVDLAGPLSLVEAPDGGLKVVNRTGMKLRGAGVVRSTEAGTLETAWLGTIEPGMAAAVTWEWRPADGTSARKTMVDDSRSMTLAPSPGSVEIPGPSEPVNFTTTAETLWPARRERDRITAAATADGELNLRSLVALAEGQAGLRSDSDPAGLRPGDVRLVAWTDQPVPGIEIDPDPSQARHGVLVVANLRYGLGEAPEPDRNLRLVAERFPSPPPPEEQPAFGPDVPTGMPALPSGAN